MEGKLKARPVAAQSACARWFLCGPLQLSRAAYGPWLVRTRMIATKAARNDHGQL
jgi:hypothetical protein